MLSPSIVIGVVVFLYGTVIGSFLNVCIHRVPRGESIVKPRSRCPGCGKQIAAWQNIPVLSFLLLRGRCGSCGQPISWRYPAVELLSGLLMTGLYLKYGLSYPFFVNSLFICLLIILIFIDLDLRILPDVFTKGGIIAGLLLSPLQDLAFMDMGLIPRTVNSLARGIGNPIISSLAGIIFGAGFLWGVAWLYLKLRKIDGMGFGDVKLIAMIGAFIGWKLTWLTILGGSLLGALLGGGYMLLKGKGQRYELPFGTFLGMAAILAVFFGPELIDWYFSRLVP